MKHSKDKKKPVLLPASDRPTQKEYKEYPLYPPAEDMMNRGERVNADLEDPTFPIADGTIPKDQTIREPQEHEDSIIDLMEPVDEFTVTEEDLVALGPKDLSMDGGDDEQLQHRTTPVDFASLDMDIPGTELDDAAERIGSEDEENNGYSLGGDNHEDLEESRP